MSFLSPTCSEELPGHRILLCPRLWGFILKYLHKHILNHNAGHLFQPQATLIIMVLYQNNLMRERLQVLLLFSK